MTVVYFIVHRHEWCVFYTLQPPPQFITKHQPIIIIVDQQARRQKPPEATKKVKIQWNPNFSNFLII